MILPRSKSSNFRSVGIGHQIAAPAEPHAAFVAQRRQHADRQAAGRLPPRRRRDPIGHDDTAARSSGVRRLRAATGAGWRHRSADAPPRSAPSPTRMLTPPRAFTLRKPASSVTSSPTKTGVRPRKSGSSSRAAIAPPLSLPAGRSSTTIFPRCSRKCPSLPSASCSRELARRLLRLGRLAIVQGQAQTLVLEHGSGMGGCEARQRRPHRCHEAGRQGRLGEVAVMPAAHQAMQPGDGQAQGCEKAVDVGDRPAGDDGQRAGEPHLQGRQQLAQFGVGQGLGRRRRQIDQRAVIVEEQRAPVEIQRRWRSGGNRLAHARGLLTSVSGARTTGYPTTDANAPLHAARSPRGRAPRRRRHADLHPGADQQRHHVADARPRPLCRIVDPAGQIPVRFPAPRPRRFDPAGRGAPTSRGLDPAADHVSAAGRRDARGCQRRPRGAGRVRPHRPSRRAQSPTPLRSSTRACPSWGCGSCCRAIGCAGFIAEHGLQQVDQRGVRPAPPDAWGARRQPRSRGRQVAAAGERLRGAARGQLHQGLLRRPGAHRPHQASRPGQEAAAAGARRRPPARIGHAGHTRRQGCRRDALRGRQSCAWRCCGWISWPPPRSRCSPARPCSRPAPPRWLPLSVLG